MLLSCDEIMFDFAKNGFSEDFDVLVQKVKEYFYKKAVEVVRCGADVVLDFGFWSSQERKQVSRYFTDRNIAYEWRYIDVSDEDWKKNISERNQLVSENKCDAYILDEGLLKKLNSQFEFPARGEMDVWVTNKREN